MKAISIGHRQVGPEEQTFIIAELSANHGQRLDVALKTIEAAAKAGADAIKLQTYTPDTMTLASDLEHFVVRTKNIWGGKKLHDLYAEAMTPWEWHATLKSAAESHGLLCFSTPFDETAVEFLEALAVPAHKVASFEIVDLPLVERIARTMKPVIISTGMASLAEIEAAVKVCREAGNDQLVLLRCVSSYPAKPESMDLRSYQVLQGFGTIIGLSDHTRDHTVAIASVALGARVIEKHFILDRSMGGPDAFFSLEPEEFAAMVRAVRDVEKALGTVRFGPSEDERASVHFRRSLLVSKDIAEGDVITCDHVRSLRPSVGLPPKFLPWVLGRRAAKTLRAGMPVTWDALGSTPDPIASVSLRPVTRDDGELLLRWRNDESTRIMFLQREPVEEQAHRAWLEKKLEDEGCVLLLIEHEGEPCGVLRYDRRSFDEWEVSITVDPRFRRRGIATNALRRGEVILRERGAARVIAQIRKDNEASIRAFKTSGFYGFTRHEINGETILRCERRIREF
jgi:pseudaminic acid synthase